MLHIPESGSHVLVLEYASEVDATQNVNVYIGGQPRDQIRTRANIYSCAYRCVYYISYLNMRQLNSPTPLHLPHKYKVVLFPQIFFIKNILILSDIRIQILFLKNLNIAL